MPTSVSDLSVPSLLHRGMSGFLQFVMLCAAIELSESFSAQPSTFGGSPALRGSGRAIDSMRPSSALHFRSPLPLRSGICRLPRMSASGDTESEEFRQKLRGAVGEMQRNLKSSALSVAATAAINEGPEAFAAMLQNLLQEGKHESVALLLVQYGIGMLEDKVVVQIWNKLPKSEEDGDSRGMMKALEALEADAEEKAEAFVRTARFLSGAANEHVEAMAILQQAEEAMALADDEEGEENDDLISRRRGLWRALCGKGKILEEKGMYKDAWEAQQRGVAILDALREEKGEEAVALALQLSALARLARLKGEYQEAVMLAERALQTTMALAEESRETGDDSEEAAAEETAETGAGTEMGAVYLELAACQQAAGMLQQALLAATKGLHLHRAAYGEAHVQTAAAMDALGLVYQSLGRYEQAADYHEQALNISAAAMGGAHPMAASALYNLATSRESGGALEEGWTLKQRALALWRDALPPGHAQLGTALNGLGENARARGEVEEAVVLFEEALGLWREALGAWHPFVGVALNNMAKAQVALGKAEEGLLLLQKSVAVKRDALGPSHPSLATSLNHLAALTETSFKDFERSAELRQEALAILKDSLGPQHPQIAVQLNNLAVTYSRMQKYADASDLYQEALAIDEETYGPKHPQVATDLNNLATLAFHCGERHLSRQLYERALSIRQEVLGADDAKTQATRRNLELVCRQIEASDTELDGA